MKKFSRLSFAYNLYSIGIFYENKVKKRFCFWENLQDTESIADFVTLRGKKCCAIKSQPISTPIMTQINIRQNCDVFLKKEHYSRSKINKVGAISSKSLNFF